ncbi:MarR family transcriptional regulator [Sphingobacterium sp. lm-10]|uniref:MarR family winged helix-turn-helix transcriptional regulator n=1 Tax=Sphingobacterium sp. lm-10 TaxID=2944904 RepID=UPI002020BAEC|nr:MarR family transcriptional regulator [Sphingobacterium sp. lm-10]MCL7986851.1 MarR family transcriptional regulator [Sphingobacterium sp. lm-10]
MENVLSFEEQYNLLNGRLFGYVSRLLNQNFKHAGINLTKEQWTVLAVLWEKNGVSQQVIANETGRDKPSTTRLLDNLQKLGYIARISHQSDKRMNIITLTDFAEQEKDKIMTVVDKTFNILTTGLTKQQIEGVRIVFKAIYSNIENQEK